MARGPSREQARRLTYRVAKRVAERARNDGGYLKKVSIVRTSENGAWCPSYRVESEHDVGGFQTVSVLNVVRLIRASNGEAAVITETVVSDT